VTTLYLTHPDCALHDMGPQHPESPARLVAINMALKEQSWYGALIEEAAPKLDLEMLYTVHPPELVEQLLNASPEQGWVAIDADTILSPHSMDAALRAAGAASYATRQVISGAADNAFCAVRPPGHHAEATIPMGFCIFNNIAVAVESALYAGLKRVAVLDFDVHHGNGTVQIFMDRPEVLVCSSFQHPFYPGRYDDIVRPNISLTPLPAGTGSDTFRHAIEYDWLPALHQHQPEMIFVSAGFDAHREDPLGGLNLEDADYIWITGLIREAADKTAGGRIVAALEGGYNLDALARSVSGHISGLVS
jgi:acetoin utilization deacetylase AcuC-like enzyme